MTGTTVEVVPIAVPLQLLVAVGAVAVAEHSPVIIGKTAKAGIGAQIDSIVIVCPLVVPQEFNTVTEAVPPVAISAAEMAAVSSVSVTNVVALSVPFHLTTSPFAKFDPFTVNIKSLPPDAIVVGDIVDNVAIGFTVTTTSSLNPFIGANFQLKNGKNVPEPLFAVIETVPFVNG